ncbi:hypothetical protein AAVH_22439 [Aphelenchoides avenae]|nr:hypothetical protein AAVH_22439 [Aphelenchus avenae]
MSGLVPIEAEIDFRSITRFYPNLKSTFDEHAIRCSHQYKAFAVENASGQRIVVVASDHSAGMNGNYRLQRVGFLPDLSILRA